MSHKLSRGQLADLLTDVIAHSKDSKKIAHEIADYLVSENQTAELDGLLRNIMARRQKVGIVEAQVTTAFPLTSSSHTQIKKILKVAYPTAKEVVITSKIQPDVLSGLRLQTIDKQLDTTARAKLDQLIQIEG